MDENVAIKSGICQKCGALLEDKQQKYCYCCQREIAHGVMKKPSVSSCLRGVSNAGVVVAEYAMIVASYISLAAGILMFIYGVVDGFGNYQDAADSDEGLRAVGFFWIFLKSLSFSVMLFVSWGTLRLLAGISRNLREINNKMQ